MVSDASYGNLKDVESEIGYLVFLCDNTEKAALIAWGSKMKAKRVARSTLTTETFAVVEGVEAAMMVK